METSSTPMASPSTSDILRSAAATAEQRNAVYKDNYKVVGDVMAVFFPNGVQLKTAHDFRRWHLFELLVVKLTRYVANWTNGGHQDSIHDAMCYAAMCEMADADHRGIVEPPQKK